MKPGARRAPRCRTCRTAPATLPVAADPPRHCEACWQARCDRLDAVARFSFDRLTRTADAERWLVRHPGVAAAEPDTPHAACAELLAFRTAHGLEVVALLHPNLPWSKVAVQLDDDDPGLSLTDLLIQQLEDWAVAWSAWPITVQTFDAREVATWTLGE